jgi:hypothetical protein
MQSVRINEIPSQGFGTKHLGPRSIGGVPMIQFWKRNQAYHDHPCLLQCNGRGNIGHVEWIWRPSGGIWPQASRNFRLYQTWHSHPAVSYLDWLLWTQLMQERQQQSCSYSCVWTKLCEMVKFVFKDWALSTSNPKTLKEYLCYSSQRKIKCITIILVSFVDGTVVIWLHMISVQEQKCVQWWDFNYNPSVFNIHWLGLTHASKR